MKIALFGLLFIASQVFAVNVPVTIKATADNDFIIMLSRGNVKSRVYVNNVGGWGVAKNTVIQVPNTDLNSCYIDFITWNQKWERGFAGSVTGDLGTLNSGDANVLSYKTTSEFINYDNSSMTFPSSNAVNQVYSTMQVMPVAIHYTHSSIWGAPSNLGFSSDVYWISPNQYPSQQSFILHRFPCNLVVKGRFVRPNPTPAPAPNPVPFPSPGPIPRPTPIPGPVPNPAPFPVNVTGDHFSCYMLEKGASLKAEMITITDQFGSAKAVLGMPKMICNPSEKIHRGVTFNIENKKRHLVCYEILEQTPNNDYDLEIKNQFETRKVRSTNREMFCVPSLKNHL